MTQIMTCENRVEKKGKQAASLLPRLAKSKNFRKMDRSLEDYIDRNPQLKITEKCVIKKLLLLRGRDDSIEVRVTHSGLGKMLNVDRRTIATALRKLVAKGFLTYVEDLYEDNCNYSKKVFRFPETFPGFDPKEVYVRRGDAKKAKARKAQEKELNAIGLKAKDMTKISKVNRQWQLSQAERDQLLEPEYERLRGLRMKRLAKLNKGKLEREQGVGQGTVDAVKCPPKIGKTTCTKNGLLLDRALNSVVRKKNTNRILPSANFVSFPSPRLAAPNAENGLATERAEEKIPTSCSQPSLEAEGKEDSKSIPSIFSLQPQFRSTILSVLSQIRKREHIRRLVGFVDYLAKANPNITSFAEYRQLAEELETAFKREFLTDAEHRRFRTDTNPNAPRYGNRGYNGLLTRMYKFFRRFISNYEPYLIFESTEENDGDDVPSVRIDDDSILGMDAEFYPLLETILKSPKSAELIPQISAFIDERVSAPYLKRTDRQEIANGLLEKLFKFCLFESHKQMTIPRLYRFLNGYLGTLPPPGMWCHSEVAEEDYAELVREFPWLDEEYQATAGQEVRMKRVIKRLKPKIHWKSFSERVPAAAL